MNLDRWKFSPIIAYIFLPYSPTMRTAENYFRAITSFFSGFVRHIMILLAITIMLVACLVSVIKMNSFVMSKEKSILIESSQLPGNKHACYEKIILHENSLIGMGVFALLNDAVEFTGSVIYQI